MLSNMQRHPPCSCRYYVNKRIGSRFGRETRHGQRADFVDGFSMGSHHAQLLPTSLKLNGFFSSCNYKSPSTVRIKWPEHDVIGFTGFLEIGRAHV